MGSLAWPGKAVAVDSKGVSLSQGKNFWQHDRTYCPAAGNLNAVMHVIVSSVLRGNPVEAC